MSDKKVERFQGVFNKTKAIMENLDKPFNLLSAAEDRSKAQAKSGTSAQEYEWADKIEGKIKLTLNMQTIRWLFLIRICLYSLIVLSFLNMFTRADFINMLLPVYMIAMFSTSFGSKMLENLKLFLIAATLTLGTDFLWLFFRSSVIFFLIFI